MATVIVYNQPRTPATMGCAHLVDQCTTHQLRHYRFLPNASTALAGVEVKYVLWVVCSMISTPFYGHNNAKTNNLVFVNPPPTVACWLKLLHHAGFGTI
eukprot:14174405-Heterocapsa_arctica.AAC.1